MKACVEIIGKVDGAERGHHAAAENRLSGSAHCYSGRA